MHSEVIRRYLEHDGHHTTVVRDGRAALTEARRIRPDLVVLDVMMPVVDGLEVCRVLRRESDVLVLMLTARATEADLLRGLEVGADDYLTKPYSPRELIARVRTLLRRAGRQSLPVRETLHIGALVVDPDTRTVRCEDRVAECTAAEFEILAALADRPGAVFTRAQLLERASLLDRNSTERTVDVHVRNLRKKIESTPSRPVYLLTVFGVGYKLVDPDRS
jgi:DNA-binding response OmpR family regulator